MILNSNRLLTSREFKTIIIRFTNNGKTCYKPNFKALTNCFVTPTHQIRLAARLFHTDVLRRAEKKSLDPIDEYDEQKSLMYNPEFEKYEKKDKKTFLETIRVYKENVKNRAGHVEFIRAALRNMEAYGVHKDLESYKKILDVLPKGVFICTNHFMAEGMYFPRQQFVVLELLNQLDSNGVIPDAELGIILKNIFGSLSHPYKKFGSLLYWSLKFKNRSEFLLPRPLPSDHLELAKLAIERITSVDLQTDVSVFQTNTVTNSIDDTWIVSGQSPKQKKLLNNHPKNEPVIVEGGDLVWLRDKRINYFILKSDGSPLPFVCPEQLDDIAKIKSKYFNPNYVKEEKPPTVHEQDDGKIYAVCATGTSSKDSLLSWVRILQERGNPKLADVPVLFRFKEPERLPVAFSTDLVQENPMS